MFNQAERVVDVIEIQRLYALDSAPGVLDLVRATPSLAAVLADAHRALREFFPDETLTLELDLDPETRDGDARLVLWIASRGEVQDALARLDRFDREWWIDRLANADDRLSISLAFE